MRLTFEYKLDILSNTKVLLIKGLYRFYQLSKLFSAVELVYQINKIAHIAASI